MRRTPQPSESWQPIMINKDIKIKGWMGWPSCPDQGRFRHLLNALATITQTWYLKGKLKRLYYWRLIYFCYITFFKTSDHDIKVDGRKVRRKGRSGGGRVRQSGRAGIFAYVISGWPAAKQRWPCGTVRVTNQCCESPCVARRVSCASDNVRSSMELLSLRNRLVCGICQLWIL